jgi:NADH:ubiquinone oxidoreductase subunit E
MEAIDRILEEFPEISGNLISILHAVQALENYLPEGSLRYLSKKTGVPLTRLYAIATFYHFFSLIPKGKHRIHLCQGTACHVKGSPRILNEVKKRLRVEEGETTEDRRFTLETVRCVGACSLAPVMVVDDKTHGNLVLKDVPNILKKFQ